MRWDELKVGDVVVSDLALDTVWLVLEIDGDDAFWFSLTKGYRGRTNGLSMRGDMKPFGVIR